MTAARDFDAFESILWGSATIHASGLLPRPVIVRRSHHILAGEGRDHPDDGSPAPEHLAQDGSK
jgi:hypothetical protein